MHIFVDESGPFAFPITPGSSSICCVAALAIGESELPAILREFDRIVSAWQLGQVETKGSKLSDRQVGKVITHLSNFDVVLTLVSIDMGLHTPGDVEAHKLDQAQRIRASADGPEFAESLREDFRAIEARVEGLSNPLYIQLRMLTLAVWRTMQTAKTRYAQTQPKALGSFSWRLDAKDTKVTEYERLWMDIVSPMVQSLSLREGLATITGPGFDYSALAPFENPVQPKAPAHLAKGMPSGAEEPFRSLDVRRIMESDLRFEDSRANPGLRLADIAANAFRRALSGRLGERGWGRLGDLLVKDFRGWDAVQYVTIGPASKPTTTISRMPYGQVATQFERKARPWKVA